MAAARHVGQRDENGLVNGWAAAFQYFDERTAVCRAQAYTQRRWRWFHRAGQRSQQPEPGLGALRSKMDPAQVLVSDVALPQQHGTTAPAFQQLLGGP